MSSANRQPRPGRGRSTQRKGQYTFLAQFYALGRMVAAQRQPARGGRVYGVRHAGGPNLSLAPFNYSGNEVRSAYKGFARGGRVYGTRFGTGFYPAAPFIYTGRPVSARRQLPAQRGRAYGTNSGTWFNLAQLITSRPTNTLRQRIAGRGRSSTRIGQNLSQAPFVAGTNAARLAPRNTGRGGRAYSRQGTGTYYNAPFIYTGRAARAVLQRTAWTGGRVYGVRHSGGPYYHQATLNYSGSEMRAVLQLTRGVGRVYGIRHGGAPYYSQATVNPNAGNEVRSAAKALPHSGRVYTNRGVTATAAISGALPTRAANVYRRYPSQVHRALVGNNLNLGDGQGYSTNNVNGIYADPNWITNLCPNPSFEAGTQGWSVTDGGTTLVQSNLNPLYGQQSGLVTTSGSIPGQGVYGPAGQFPLNDGLASASVSLWGESGMLLVSLVSNTGGTVLSSQSVVLNGAGYQTVNFNAIPYGAGCQLYILVTTLGSPQAISFYIDGVMYTPDGYHLTPYVDGDQANCFWTGTPELSTSYQQFQYPISAALSFYLTGVCNAIEPGETFEISTPPVLEFFVDPLTGATATVQSPAAAFTDFGMWELTDPDPAQTYGWWTNAGTSSSQTGYTQIYGMFTPPLDYQVSGGNYLWRRAAYAAVGFKWANVPNNVEQILTDVQVEYAKTSVGSASTPSSYQRPRQLQVVIKPSRLNYATNPAFANGTAGWTQDGTNVTMAVSNTVWPANLATYDNVEYSAFQSCLVTLNNPADAGIQLSVPLLIPGQVYMASCYVMPNSTGITDILASCGGGSADVAGLINAADGYGSEAYGSGPYGGINGTNNGLPTGGWTRVSFPFVAATDTQTFIIAADVQTPTVFPQSFYVTALLIESGDILNPYFDGNSGPDACWEYTGGTTNPVANGGTTPGTSRSYYYNQLRFGQGVVNATMQSNTPLGISYATPLYATPPLQ
jgi:hypothetical protein